MATPVHRPERPRTALATMRHRGEDAQANSMTRDSTVQIVARDQVRSLAVPCQQLQQQQQQQQQPLILTRREFERILLAAKVLTPAEREEQRRREQEALELAGAEAEKRKQELATLDADDADTTSTSATLARERAERERQVLERARVLLEEEAMPEVKKLNMWINEAKCSAIRDLQMADKEKKL